MKFSERYPNLCITTEQYVLELYDFERAREEYTSPLVKEYSKSPSKYVEIYKACRYINFPATVLANYTSPEEFNVINDDFYFLAQGFLNENGEILPIYPDAVFTNLEDAEVFAKTLLKETV